MYHHSRVFKQVLHQQEDALQQNWGLVAKGEYGNSER